MVQQVVHGKVPAFVACGTGGGATASLARRLQPSELSCRTDQTLVARCFQEHSGSSAWHAHE
jgi:hypothetical protein